MLFQQFTRLNPADTIGLERFREGLVFQAHRLLYHATLGLRVMKKGKEVWGVGYPPAHGFPNESIPTPFTLHPAPFTLQLAPCNLNPAT